MNAFGDIIIKRFNVHKQTRDRIKVRLVYAPKQRVLNDLLDRDQNIQLPVMACYIGGISRDQNRVFNKILGTTVPARGDVTSSYNEKTPLPIDVTYNISIMTRYQEDMDQILSHLIPYVNPYFVVSWRTPQRPDYEIRSNVIWGGSVNIQYPTDLNSSQVARVVADLSFTFKGWMFQGIPDNPIGNIHVVNMGFNNNIEGIPIEYLLETELQQANENNDYVVVEGVPPQPKIIAPYFMEVGTLQQFNVHGAGFKIINNVYLSGAPLSASSASFNPFISSVKLSADYPSFEAVKLDSSKWSHDREHFLTFISPSAEQAGRLDLIVEGPAGYGKLTEYVRVNTFNPHKPGTFEYNIFEPYQFPFLSGIEVRNY